MIDVSEIETLARDGQSVRIAWVDGVAFVVASDLCRLLGYANAPAVMQRINEVHRIRAALPNGRVAWLVNWPGALQLLSGGTTRKLGNEFAEWLRAMMKKPAPCSNTGGPAITI